MLGRSLISFLRRNPVPESQSSSSSAKLVVEDEAKTKKWARRLVSGTLICLTGGVALSALDDLAIFYGCSSKAMEKASKNQALIDAIGEPIVRGPWYNASLAVTLKSYSVSCTFPVSGPRDTGIFQLRAVPKGGIAPFLPYVRGSIFFSFAFQVVSCPCIKYTLPITL